MLHWAPRPAECSCQWFQSCGPDKSATLILFNECLLKDKISLSEMQDIDDVTASFIQARVWDMQDPDMGDVLGWLQAFTRNRAPPLLCSGIPRRSQHFAIQVVIVSVGNATGQLFTGLFVASHSHKL